MVKIHVHHGGNRAGTQFPRACHLRSRSRQRVTATRSDRRLFHRCLPADGASPSAWRGTAADSVVRSFPYGVCDARRRTEVRPFLDSFSFLPRYRGARHQAVESYVVNRRRTGKSGAAPLHPLERTAGSGVRTRGVSARARSPVPLPPVAEVLGGTEEFRVPWRRPSRRSSRHCPSEHRGRRVIAGAGKLRNFPSGASCRAHRSDRARGALLHVTSRPMPSTLQNTVR